MQCTEGLNYLSRLNAQCGAPRGHAGCSRVSCSHNCGIFLCNDVSLAPFPFSRLDVAADHWHYLPHRTPSPSVFTARTLPVTPMASLRIASKNTATGSSRSRARSSGTWRRAGTRLSRNLAASGSLFTVPASGWRGMRWTRWIALLLSWLTCQSSHRLHSEEWSRLVRHHHAEEGRQNTHLLRRHKLLVLK
jgi:hypothetical protein